MNDLTFQKRLNNGDGDDLIVIQNVEFEFRQDLRHYCLLCFFATVATASKRVTMITSTHNLPLSSLS